MKFSQSFPRKVLYTNNLAKKIYGFLKNKSVAKYYNLNHLSLLELQRLNGAIFRDEALFIYSLVKMIRPRVVVEFGFSRGHSSLNFLYAIDKKSNLFSFDISESAKDLAESVFKDFPNFHFRFKSQLDFTPQDVNNLKIDLVYFDAVYDQEINLNTFEKISPSLNEDAIIILHDTSIWKKEFMDDTHVAYAKKSRTTG